MDRKNNKNDKIKNIDKVVKNWGKTGFKYEEKPYDEKQNFLNQTTRDDLISFSDDLIDLYNNNHKEILKNLKSGLIVGGIGVGFSLATILLCKNFEFSGIVKSVVDIISNVIPAGLIGIMTYIGVKTGKKYYQNKFIDKMQEEVSNARLSKGYDIHANDFVTIAEGVTLNKEEFIEFLAKDKSFNEVQEFLNEISPKGTVPFIKPLLTEDGYNWDKLYELIEDAFRNDYTDKQFDKIIRKIKKNPLVEKFDKIGDREFSVNIAGKEGVVSKNKLPMADYDCIENLKCYSDVSKFAELMGKAGVEGNAVVGIMTTPNLQGSRYDNVTHCVIETKEYYHCPQLNCSMTKGLYEAFNCFVPFVSISVKEVYQDMEKCRKVFKIINNHPNYEAEKIGALRVSDDYYLLAHKEFMEKINYMLENPQASYIDIFGYDKYYEERSKRYREREAQKNSEME